MVRFTRNAHNLPYGAIQSIADQNHLSHMSDTIIEEYEEHADD